MRITDLVDTTTVPAVRLIACARDLKSEHGENPEYDRALVELTASALGFDTDEHRPDVAHLLGIETP